MIKSDYDIKLDRCPFCRKQGKLKLQEGTAIYLVPKWTGAADTWVITCMHCLTNFELPQFHFSPRNINTLFDKKFQLAEKNTI